MTDKADLFTILDLAERDMRAGLAKLTELRAHLANLPLPDTSRARCPDCHLTFKGPRGLSEHVYITHGGPEPTHWLEAEQRSSV